MSEIEFPAETQGMANDLLRQATGLGLHASEAGRLGWTYTGPPEHVVALAALLDECEINYIISN